MSCDPLRLGLAFVLGVVELAHQFARRTLGQPALPQLHGDGPRAAGDARAVHGRKVGSICTTTIEPGGFGLWRETNGWSIQPPANCRRLGMVPRSPRPDQAASYLSGENSLRRELRTFDLQTEAEEHSTSNTQNIEPPRGRLWAVVGCWVLGVGCGCSWVRGYGQAPGRQVIPRARILNANWPGHRPGRLLRPLLIAQAECDTFREPIPRNTPRKPCPDGPALPCRAAPHCNQSVPRSVYTPVAIFVDL